MENCASIVQQNVDSQNTSDNQTNNVQENILSQQNNSPIPVGSLIQTPKIALPIMMDEYTKERERKGILENKAIALITILLALVTVYMPIIPIDKIRVVYEKGTRNQLMAIAIFIFIFVSSLCLIGICFYKLIMILKITEYKVVDIEEILKDDSLAYSEDKYELALCNHYKELILHNSECNKIKSKKLGNCFIETVVAFFLLLFVCIGMMII